MHATQVNADRIAAVEKIIRPHVRHTPILEVAGADFEDGRVAHVGPDDFFDCGDAVCVNLRGVHSCCYLSNSLSVGVL